MTPRNSNARGENRTPMPLPAGDFESATARATDIYSRPTPGNARQPSADGGKVDHTRHRTRVTPLSLGQPTPR